MSNPDLNTIPQELTAYLEGRDCRTESIGRSGASVYIFSDRVLKIEKTSPSADREAGILAYLEGKLPAPRILAFARQEGKNYLLMTRLTGNMACAESALRRPEEAVCALADGLRQLWSIGLTDCPFSSRLEGKLKAAGERIEQGQVNQDELDEHTLGAGGFADVASLYRYLCDNRPSEDLVFTHGDYCLPNIFAAGRKTVGFLDLGSAGVADRWQDISLCIRSLGYNLRVFGNCPESEIRSLTTRLFGELGLAPDPEKIRYYTLLDELF